MFSDNLHVDLETMIQMDGEEVSVLALNWTSQEYCLISSRLLD